MAKEVSYFSIFPGYVEAGEEVSEDGLVGLWGSRRLKGLEGRFDCCELWEFVSRLKTDNDRQRKIRRVHAGRRKERKNNRLKL